ncbi:hypothetical protein ACTI_41870 [Actinoplanes sp. OR16]|uniref:hypothetical protein n=1 Tax=Actinoplanes sp. OR16 TaxID=946334 RepID=UPI000F7074D8|nr:hypothetical protein [Actinoplanes sp. OR16]BBH67502.1 hypothetical protein ACTI_41870 [Actinoplanes sp. OR16]
MRLRRYLGWMLPLSIVTLTLGVVGAIAWMTSRVMDSDPALNHDTTNARPCTATIRSIADTNMILDDEHVYRIELDVKPSDGTAEHHVTLRDPLTAEQVNMATPGAVFECLADQDDPTRVEIVWSQ